MAANQRGMALAGFVAFAGAMLMVTGLINVFQGLVALVADDRLVMTPDDLVVVDVTAWGWVLIVSGLLLMAVGGGVLSAVSWARFAAIVVVGLHAVTQVAWLGAYPIWSLLMIALDTVVLFALIARWSDVRDRLGGVGDAPWHVAEGTDYTVASARRIPPMG
ncbi:DUF7144 family membrane protein [Kribbella sp. CA-253562]|uniref:DUF7144 family membrane protein n=1 Tax=Kribbella sp. CA-253562 TaxID=3239942 RepID=UPI003D8D3217